MATEAVTRATAPQTPLDRYTSAIAARNIAWSRWQDARELHEWSPSSANLGELNAAQHDFEHAERDLVKARVFLGASIAEPADQLAAYRSDHRIVRVRALDPADGHRCAVDGLRVLSTNGGGQRHHPDDIRRLVERVAVAS